MSPPTRAMRICDLNTLWIDGGEGGVNTYLYEKARHLSGAGNGFAHTIVVPGAADGRRTIERSSVYTLKSPPLPWNPDHRVLFRFEDVRRILREVRPHVVEVDCSFFLGRVAARELGDAVPVLGFYHVHLPTFIARAGLERVARPLGFFAERAAYRYLRFCNRHCRRILVSSADIETRLRHEGFSRLVHVPLGVNPALFRPSGNGRPPDEGTTLLYVGRLSHEKDLDILAQAFARLGTAYRLRIVGEGPIRPYLEERARLDPRIEVVGGRSYGEALAREYARADIFVNPSPNETFNLTILEAFSAGLPVVTAARGGSSDRVPPGLGELFQPGDPQDLARKVERVASSMDRYAGGRRHVEAACSWTRTFERLLDVYRTCLAER